MYYIGDVKIRVRYAETDRMGYVYYGNYPTYYEVARTEVLRQMGLTYKQLEDDGYLLPIAKMTVEYIKPALYDDLLTIKVFVDYTKVRLEFVYEVYNQKNELINKGYTLLIFTSAKTRRPTFAPQYFLDLMEQYKQKVPKVEK